MKIWMLNHYATNMYFDGAGRHHSLAKYLIRMGHDVRIFCSNYGHNGGDNIEITRDDSLDCKGKDEVNYTFIKTTPYTGNGISRIKNMISFYINVQRICKRKVKKETRPDIILASSVHPLTLVAGIKIAKKFKIPCVCEIRDIWPLTLVEFKKLKKNSLLHKILLKLELWTYKNADKIIFTMEGGNEYIKDMHWDKIVPKEKIEYVNNGVDLELFESNKEKYQYNDEYLKEGNKTFVYAGSIGQANKVDKILEVAEKCMKNNLKDINFLIFGDGPQKERIEREANNMGLKNIKFRGHVEKKYIPSIVSKSYANLIFIEQIDLYKYGTSSNKSFDYLAAAKPIVLDYNFAYNYILNNRCGIVNENLYEGVNEILNINKEIYRKICMNAKETAAIFDFNNLAEKMYKIFIDLLM